MCLLVLFPCLPNDFAIQYGWSPHILPVFPQWWRAHLYSPDGLADRFINSFFSKPWWKFFFMTVDPVWVTEGAFQWNQLMGSPSKDRPWNHKGSCAMQPVWGCVGPHPSLVSHSAIRSNLTREEVRRREAEMDRQIWRRRLRLSWTPLRRGCGLDDYTATDDVSGGSLPSREHKHTRPQLNVFPWGALICMCYH